MFDSKVFIILVWKIKGEVVQLSHFRYQMGTRSSLWPPLLYNITTTDYFNISNIWTNKRTDAEEGARRPCRFTCACIGELRVEVLIRRLGRRKLLLQTESRHQLLKEDACPVTVPAETAHDVIGRMTWGETGRGRERDDLMRKSSSVCGLFKHTREVRTYDSEVLVKQSHVDRQQLRQSDGQTAAQTDVRISRVHQVQHWERQREQGGINM